MARVAGLGEVCRNVVRVRRALKILQVAIDAGRAGQAVVVVDMAVSALPWRHGMQACESESRGRVIELAIRPQHRVVALLARCGKTHMRHRRSRAVVIRLVATDAGRAGDAVIVVDVAIGTLPRRHGVRAG